MNQTFTLICLMMTLAQSRVLMTNRRLMQKAQEKPNCVTFSIVKPSEAGAHPSWLTNVWGIKVVPDQPNSKVKEWCLYDAFREQLPKLAELGYTYKVHDEANAFSYGEKRPEYLVIWFEGSASDPKDPSSGKYTEKVYKLGKNPLLSIFGTPSYFWQGLTEVEAKLVKHTPDAAYDVDPNELRELSERAVGGVRFEESKMEHLVSELEKKGVSEVKYQGTLPKPSFDPIHEGDTAFEFSLPRDLEPEEPLRLPNEDQNYEEPEEDAEEEFDEGFTDEKTEAEASKRLENLKKYKK